MLLASGIVFEQVLTEPVMEFRSRDGLVQTRPDDEVADVGVGLEQDGGGKEDVVNANDAVLVQLDVVDEGEPRRSVKFSA